MDELRSLEGVGHLLSQKLHQNNSKIKLKPKHKRSTSVPTKLNGDTTTSISISTLTYFPPQLAATLANGINKGFNQMPSNQPNLVKSQSGFSRKDIPKQTNNNNNNNQPKDNNNNNNDNITRGGASTSVHFAEVNHDNVQNVNTPTQSMSPPLSPTAFQKLSLDNQYGHNSGTSYSQRGSIHNHFSALPQSPSYHFAMGSFRTHNSLHLDLGDIGLLADDESQLSTISRGGSIVFPPPLDAMHTTDNSSYTMPGILSPQEMEYNNSIQSPKNNTVPPLRKTYSNNELFTLYSDHDMSSTDDINVLANNTKLNSSIPKNMVPILSEKKSDHMNYVCDMNMNLEDFMEYQSEQKDAFNNIGNGASGIVRKAFHFRSCKMVAIKQCRSKQKHEIDAFMKEAKLYEKFNWNNNIANIMGFGKDDNGNFAMAMEYMDLGSCDALNIHELKEDDINKELIVAHIVYETLKGLIVIHEKLYVHNDIKPANILCNKYGEIKLSDFGTVLTLKSKKHRLKKNNGTQRYQSPEKMVLQPIRYNTKTDIWSIGVTTYELLFGDSYNSQDELAYITNTPKLNDKKKYGNLSSECCNFMTLCFEKDYEKRASAKQLIQHEWFQKYIIEKDINQSLWPWYIAIPGTEKECMVQNAIDNYGSKSAHGRGRSGGILQKKNKQVIFADNVIDNQKKKGNSTDNIYNEDLLFMISALIIYYSAQFFDMNENNNGNEIMLHRRRSQFNKDKQNGKTYSDDERITNMAKYACCSKEMVLDKIRLTVNYIKSQINQL